MEWIHNRYLYDCTVGGNVDKDGHIYYPRLGDNVVMFSNSSIIGKCNIGNNVLIGAGTTVKNQDIPDNSIVFGQSPNTVIKQINRVKYV